MRLKVVVVAALVLPLLGGACGFGKLDPDDKSDLVLPDPSDCSGEECECDEGCGPAMELLGAQASARLGFDWEIDHGLVTVGGRSARELHIHNAGKEPLKVWAVGNLPAPFSVDLQGKVEVGVGKRQELRVAFEPQEAGDFETELEFVTNEWTESGDPKVRRVRLKGRAVQASFSCDPTTLHLGRVVQGGERTGSVDCRNLMDVSVTVSLQPSSDAYAKGFSATLDRGDGERATLEAGESVSIEVTFSANTVGTIRSAFHLKGENEGTVASVQVEALAVQGPEIACTPSSLDFGDVPVGATMSRSIRCSNTLAVPAGAETEPLVLRKVSSDNEHFVASLRSEDGSSESRPDGYLPGESFFIDLRYTPTAETRDEGKLFVESTAGANPSLSIPVEGSGRSLAPCEYSVTPPSLQFGVIGRGEQRTIAFAIENHLESEACLVNGLRLSDDSDSVFSVEEVISAEIGPGSSLSVPVTFSPGEETSYAGQVEFHISDAGDKGPKTVDLHGMGGPVCLQVDAGELDFGPAPPGCELREQTVRLYNNCAVALRLQDLRLDGPSRDWFEVTESPSLPSELGPGGWAEVSVAYAPGAPGQHHAVLEFLVEDRESVHVALRGSGKEGTTRTDVFEHGVQKVDVLWVIDNSGSMGPYQDMLRQNLPAVLGFALERELDFQLGVTTSGLTAHGSGCPGGAGGGENGRLFPVDNSYPRILHARMPWQQLEEAWSNNVRVGTCHGTEPMYEAARRALSPPVIDNAKVPGTPHPHDGNLGFLRPDAALSIILVHDESDQDSVPFGSVEEFVDFFRSLKPGEGTDSVRVHAISGGKIKGACAASACPRCVEGTERTGGKWLDICTPTATPGAWATALEELSQAVFGFGSVYALRAQPLDRNGDGKVDEQDLQVKVNGQVRPPRTEDSETVWSYDPIDNSISFAAGALPEPDEAISVTYDFSCD